MTEPTENPFRAADDADHGDVRLALAAAAGDGAALEALVSKHQRWVYAIAVRMMLNPADAADVAQEALLRVITRIGQFEGRSSFRTWAYRIVMNCFLDAKRGRLEGVVTSFRGSSEVLDRIPLEDLDEPPSAERTLLVEEAKLGCMLGMLLCLDREQRLAFVLGEIFECPSPLAADILNITPAGGGRMQLARALPCRGPIEKRERVARRECRCDILRLGQRLAAGRRQERGHSARDASDVAAQRAGVDDGTNEVVIHASKGGFDETVFVGEAAVDAGLVDLGEPLPRGPRCVEIDNNASERAPRRVAWA